MDAMADDVGVRPYLVPEMQRNLNPVQDAIAFLKIRRLIQQWQPSIIHTHTAKAGFVGRAAALSVGRSHRPSLIVHTFHGHVLSGYFSPRKERVFAAIERFLGQRSDILIAVSPEVRDDLLARRIGSAEKVRVVPLGLPLGRFDASDEERGRRRRAVREGLGIDMDAHVVTIVARLVPIKRIDIFLEAAEILAARLPEVRFIVAGGGEMEGALRRSAPANRLGTRVLWPGFVDDTPALYDAADVVTLCSDNEGTPVSLIEALASGVPVVATSVGGVPYVLGDGAYGRLVAPADPQSLAQGIEWALTNRSDARRMAIAGMRSTSDRFSLDRLADDLAGIYDA